MIAFTEVLTEILLGEPTFVARAANIPPHEQAVPVVVIEEIMRGRLQVIRQAEAGKARMSLPDAYQLGGWPLQRNVWSYVYAPEGKRRGQSSRLLPVRRYLISSNGRKRASSRPLYRVGLQRGHVHADDLGAN